MIYTKRPFLTSAVLLLTLTTVNCPAGKGDKNKKKETQKIVVKKQKRSTILGKKKLLAIAAATVASTTQKRSGIISDLFDATMTAERAKRITAFSAPKWKTCISKAVHHISTVKDGDFAPLLSLLATDLSTFLSNLQHLCKNVTTLDLTPITPAQQTNLWKVIKELLHIRTLINTAKVEATSETNFTKTVQKIISQSALLTFADEFGAAHPEISEPIVNAAFAYAESESVFVSLFSWTTSRTLSTVLKSSIDKAAFVEQIPNIITSLDELDAFLERLTEVTLPTPPCQDAITVLQTTYGMTPENATFRRS
jgi:hypothetical protein